MLKEKGGPSFLLLSTKIIKIYQQERPNVVLTGRQQFIMLDGGGGVASVQVVVGQALPGTGFW
jgi:hypothetical protein